MCVEGGFLVWLSYSGREFLALIVFLLLIVSLCLSLCLSDMIMALISFEALSYLVRIKLSDPAIACL